MLYHQMTQYFFDRQWSRLKAYANERDILIIGDLPIYVSRDSVEMWATPELFKIDAAGNPVSVAGTPPDQLSATGQYWGNPIYDWDAMESDGFSWWEGRIRAALDMYDVIRLDHFRGFEAYWEVPFSSPDSSYGSWTQSRPQALQDTRGKARHAAHHRRGPGLPHPRRHRYARQLGLPRHEDPAVCL